MNSICLTGRLTKDIELKQTPNGISVCSFSIAVKRPNVKDTTDFIDCVAWRNTAEFVNRYFKRGQMIAVNGVLTVRKFDDKDGNKRTAYEVQCDRCEFCGGDNNKTASGSENEQTEEPKYEPIDTESDLPF